MYTQEVLMVLWFECELKGSYVGSVLPKAAMVRSDDPLSGTLVLVPPQSLSILLSHLVLFVLCEFLSHKLLSIVNLMTALCP